MSEFVPGLAGVVAARSAISFINGTEGVLRYRGIRIEDLAAKSTFEEVVYLLIEGALPTRTQLAAFDAELRALRGVPEGIFALLRALPTETHPMVALQAAAAAMGGFYPHFDVSSRAGNREAALRLTACLPGIVAGFDRIRRGLEPLASKPELSHAADFLWLLNGEVPDAQETRILDLCLVLHAEHGFNASTFTGRVVASALANPYAVVSAAVGTLSGPLHGGANEEVLNMLRTIDAVADVPAFLQGRIDNKQKIMGLRHRVYKVKDPRAGVLQELAVALFEDKGSTPLYDIAYALEQEARVKLGGKGIYPNVDFYSGLVYDKLGFATDLFTPIFAVSRVSGWTAHWLEQLEANRIYRPTQQYVGAMDAPYTDIDSRGA